MEKAKKLDTPAKQTLNDVLSSSDPAWLQSQFGHADLDFVLPLVQQLVVLTATSSGRANEDKVMFAISTLASMAPRDAGETMLATQMIAVHQAILAMSRRLTDSLTIDHQDSASRSLNNLSRTYGLQLDALKRYRYGAKQAAAVDQAVTIDQGASVEQATVKKDREERAAIVEQALMRDRSVDH